MLGAVILSLAPLVASADIAGPRPFDMCHAGGETQEAFYARPVKEGWTEVTLDPQRDIHEQGRALSPEDLAVIHALVMNGTFPSRTEAWVKKGWAEASDVPLLFRHFRGDIERVYARGRALLSVGVADTPTGLNVHCLFVGPGTLYDFPFTAARHGREVQTSAPLRFTEAGHEYGQTFHGRFGEVSGEDATRIFETEIPDLALFTLTFHHPLEEAGQ